jgi:hypothetical protein
MVVGIFGSSGYLGTQAALLCESLSLDYVCLERNIDKYEKEFLHKITVIIDCGFPRNYYKRGVAASYLTEIKRRKYFFEFLGPKYIYIGTFTGILTKSTHYSRIKQEAEEIFESFGASILRAGLVASANRPGGRYLELKDMLEKLPVSLVPAENWFPVVITDLDDFIHHLTKLMNSDNDRVTIPVTILPLRSLILERTPKKVQLKINSLVCQIFSWTVRLLPLKKLEGIKAIVVPVSFSKELILKISDRG